MEVKELKEKLHFLIDNSSEDTLKYVYSFFEETDYEDDFKAILNEEYNNYQLDKTIDSRNDVNTTVAALLKSKHGLSYCFSQKSNKKVSAFYFVVQRKK